MFEQGLAFVLKRVLQDFVEDGDKLQEKVQGAVFAGKLVLQDLQIKPSVLDALNLPLKLHHAYVGSLEVVIPWTKLGYEPVTVVVNQVQIVVEPKYEWNEGAPMRREQAMKQARLAAAELFAANRLQPKAATSSSSWWLNALLSKLLDKIQVTVRDVHIRFEDVLSCPSEFSLGFSFESLHLQSRDPSARYEEFTTPSKSANLPDSDRNYEKELSISGSSAVYKLIELNQVSIYWNPLHNVGQDTNPCNQKFIGRSPEVIRKLMAMTIASRGSSQLDRPRHHYILQPLDLTILADFTLTGQKSHIRVFISEIAIQMEDRQVREMISASLNFTNFLKLEKYSHLRPNCSVSENPATWLRYAIEAVLSQVRSKMHKRYLTRSNFNRRIEDKFVYVELWKSKMITSVAQMNKLKLQEKDLSLFLRKEARMYGVLVDQVRERRRAGIGFETKVKPAMLLDESYTLLKKMEFDLDYEDILYFRTIAGKSFSIEEQKASWASSIFGLVYGNGQSKDGVGSEEEKKKLYEAMKIDPESLYRAHSNARDVNEVDLVCSVYLKEASITLALSVVSQATFSSGVPFLKFKITDLKQKLVSMGGGLHTKVFLSLQDFEGFELLPSLQRKKRSSEYRAIHILHRRILKQQSIDKGSETESNLSMSEERSTLGSVRAHSMALRHLAPLISLAVEIYPPNSSEVEMAVNLDVEELEVWITPDPKWINSLVVFGTWPEDQQYWSEAEMKAMNQLADMKARFDAKLAHMMENHASIKIEGRVIAPVLIVHDSRYDHGEGKVDVLIVDLGEIVLTTDKLAKVARQRELDSRSHFTMQASSVAPSMMMNSSKLPAIKDDRRDWELLQDTNSAKETPMLRDLAPVVRVLGFEEESMQDFAFDKPGRRSSGLHIPMGQQDDNEPEYADLFDIFHCRVSKVEVYLLELSRSDARMHGHNLWNMTSELEKTIIVPEFEVFTEIQVSVLPWDEEIPPFKLLCSISEVYVMISDMKILRLLSFAQEITESTKRMQQLQEKRREKFPIKAKILATNEDVIVPMLKKVEKAKSLKLIAARQRKPRSRSLGSSSAYDESDYKSLLSGHAPSMRESRNLKGAALLKGLALLGGDQVSVVESVGMMHDDDDDDSFFSAEGDGEVDLEDNERMIEELKYLIGQRESIRSRLITDIRLNEQDTSKLSVIETLKKELLQCEMNLHQLKVSYVEALVQQNSDDLPVFSKAQEGKADQLRKEMDALYTPTKSGTGVGNEGTAAADKKYNFTNAKDIHYEPNDEADVLERAPHKELVHVQLMLHKLNVDFDTALSISQPSSCFRFTVMTMGLKLKHRVENTRITFYLKDIVFSRQPTDVSNKMLIANSIPILTSDTTIFATFAVPVNARPYNGSSAPDFLKVRYDINYGQTSNKHAISMHLNYLGINAVADELLPLVDEALRITYLVQLKFKEKQPSPPETSLQPQQSSNGETKQSPFQNIDLSFALKVDNIVASIFHGHEPIMNATITSAMLRGGFSQGKDAFCTIRVVDIALFDLTSSTKNVSYLRSEKYHVPTTNTIFSKNTTLSTRLISISIRANDFNADIVQMEVDSFIAPVCLLVDSHLLVQAAITAKEMMVMISGLAKKHPFLLEQGPSSPGRQRSMSATKQQLQLKSATIEAGGASVHIIFSVECEVSLSAGTLSINANNIGADQGKLHVSLSAINAMISEEPLLVIDTVKMFVSYRQRSDEEQDLVRLSTNTSPVYVFCNACLLTKAQELASHCQVLSKSLTAIMSTLPSEKKVWQFVAVRKIQPLELPLRLVIETDVNIPLISVLARHNNGDSLSAFEVLLFDLNIQCTLNDGTADLNTSLRALKMRILNEAEQDQRDASSIVFTKTAKEVPCLLIEARLNDEIVSSEVKVHGIYVLVIPQDLFLVATLFNDILIATNPSPTKRKSPMKSNKRSSQGLVPSRLFEGEIENQKATPSSIPMKVHDATKRDNSGLALKNDFDDTTNYAIFVDCNQLLAWPFAILSISLTIDSISVLIPFDPEHRRGIDDFLQVKVGIHTFINFTRPPLTAFEEIGSSFEIMTMSEFGGNITVDLVSGLSFTRSVTYSSVVMATFTGTSVSTSPTPVRGLQTPGRKTWSEVLSNGLNPNSLNTDTVLRVQFDGNASVNMKSCEKAADVKTTHDLLAPGWSVNHQDCAFEFGIAADLTVESCEVKCAIDAPLWESFQLEVIDGINERIATLNETQFVAAAPAPPRSAIVETKIDDFASLFSRIAPLVSLEVRISVPITRIAVWSGNSPQSFLAAQIQIKATEITVKHVPAEKMVPLLALRYEVDDETMLPFSDSKESEARITPLAGSNLASNNSRLMMLSGRMRQLFRGVTNTSAIATTEASLSHQRSILMQTPSVIRVTVKTSVEVAYQNQRLLALEPLVEPMMIELSVVQNINDQGVSCYLIHNRVPLLDYADIDESLQRYMKALNADLPPPDKSLPAPKFDVSIDKVNVNVTVPFLENLFMLYRAISVADHGLLDRASSSGSLHCTAGLQVIIRNETGLPIVFGRGGRDSRLLHSGNEINYDMRVHEAGNGMIITIKRPDGSFWPDITGVSFTGSGSRLYQLSNGTTGKKDSFTTVVLDLSSRDGKKQLTIRSSLRIFNSTKVSMSIQFMDVSHGKFVSPVWEVVLAGGRGIFVPINICSNPSYQLLVLSTERKYELKGRRIDAAGMIPSPEAIGHERVSQSEDSNDTSNNPVNPSQNKEKRRKQLKQRKGVLNMLSYYHWLNLSQHERMSQINEEDSHERIKVLYRHSFCNLAIESRDAPSRRSMSNADFSLLRTIKVLPTVTVLNLLGRDIHIALAPDSITQPLPQLLDDKFPLKEYIPQYHLKPGEATESLSFHSTETFCMVIRFYGEESVYSLGWSSEVRVTGCVESNQQSSSEMLQAEIDFKNGSSLIVSVEVVDRGGCRIINLFTPFWVVGNSFLPIQVQHDPKFHPSAMEKLNGSDDLSADQHFCARQPNYKKDKTARRVVQSHASKFGIGRARGMNGVLLGPSLPLRGLADAFGVNLAASAVISRLNVVQQKGNTGYKQRKESGSLKPIPLVRRPSDLTSTYNGSDGTINNGNSNRPSLSYSQNSSNENAILTIIHSDYSNPARKQCRLKFRNRNTRWTSTIAAEQDGTKDISVNCLYDKSIDDYDGEHSINSPFVKDGHKVLHFGVNTVTLDPPFHRTKAVFVMDRFTVVNLLNQSLEIRQFGEDNVIAIRSGGEEPMWFRTAHNLLCQVRLSKFGWNWSGKFSLNMKGETPIRMMNEYDNTVFFLQIFVHIAGGQVKVIFKGGDRFSPFRFENHSMETFRIHQRGQKQLTNLLPYHYCAYAWDEPLEEHAFILSLQQSNLSSASSSSDTWEKIGMFTFERIERLKHTSRPYLMLKIVTQGPTRVLQIFDTRMSSLSLASSKNNRMSLTGSSSADSMLLRLNVMIRAIGISIVDQTPQELLFISLANVSVETQVAKSSLEVLFGVGRLQIDNQLWSTPFPSLLHPLVPLKDGMNSSFSTTSISSSERRKQSILIHVKQSFDFDGVYFFPLMRFEIAPFDLNVEMNVIAAVINMVSYAYEEFQETTVISRQQRLILGFGQDSSASTVSQYDVYDAISCTPIALGMLQTKLTRAQILSIYRHFRQLTRSRSSFHNSHMHSAYSSEENIHSNSSQQQQQHDMLFERTLSIFYLTNILKKAKTISETTTPKSKVYLQHFEISKFRLNISFNPVLQTEINAIGLGLGFGSESQMSLLFGAFSTLMLAIGSSLANIDNCPLRFSALEMKHIFASSSGFADRIVNTYTMEAVKQAYLVLFSSQLLGNPIQLLQTVGGGLWDFVNLPFAKGMDTSPEAFLIGLCQGSLSLLRTVVASLCTTTSHLASSLQVGLLTLGAVDGYGRDIDSASSRTRPLMLFDSQPTAAATGLDEKRTEQWALTKRPRRRPHGLVDAVQMAALGLILDPWEGYRDYGLTGLVTGSVKGGVGLVARPLYGALDLTVGILEQISFQLLPMYLASQKMRLNRMRPPRFFANPNMPMQIYSAEENIGQELLSRVEQGRLRNDGYLWHGHITTAISSTNNSSNELKLLLLLTKQRILLLEERWEFSGVLWQCILKDILSIEIDYNDSIPVETQEEMKRDLDSVLQLIQAPSSSTNSSSKSTFRSRLHGKPRLVLYYIPQHTSSSASGERSNHSSARKSTNKHQGGSTGLRLSQQKICMSSHEQLIHLLNRLLQTAPNLASPDVLTYLKATGVDVDGIIRHLVDQYQHPEGEPKTILASPTAATISPLPSTIKGFPRVSKSSKKSSTNSSKNNSRGSLLSSGDDHGETGIAEETAAVEERTSDQQPVA